jgi:hypothetical protein
MANEYETRVQAVQVASGLGNKDELEAFLEDGQRIYTKEMVVFHFACGKCTDAYPGWWIFKDWRGRYQSVSPEEFAAKFQKV